MQSNLCKSLPQLERMGIITDINAAAIWEEIELAESYLVCSMFERAASLASSILKRLRDHVRDIATKEEAAQVYDMLESTGMVLVQSFKALERTSEILNQLGLYFVSVKSIPAQVFLTGYAYSALAILLKDGSPSGVREYLEEFLSGWILGDGQYCSAIAEANLEFESRYDLQFVLGIDKYLEIVEVYTVTLLGTVLNDVDLAISWVEKASLPKEKQQCLNLGLVVSCKELLRRLHSMRSFKSTSLSQIPPTQSPANNNEACSPTKQHVCEASPILKGKDPDNKKLNSKEVILKLSERIEPCLWCFRAIKLKFGAAQFVLSGGKIILGCLILLLYYVFRKKQASVKRVVGRQLAAVRRALVDMWQLAFSYQVNPLAAVQPLPTATRGGQ
ncbi:protein APEM9 [Senna tora]|uniref:Protein APEM9 n=1 Tax=Senna tora TaxID=362788 RepID=A0A834VYV5_9FABA|nr:protein APEM9 [Senna tora]